MAISCQNFVEGMNFLIFPLHVLHSTHLHFRQFSHQVIFQSSNRFSDFVRFHLFLFEVVLLHQHYVITKWVIQIRFHESTAEKSNASQKDIKLPGTPGCQSAILYLSETRMISVRVRFDSIGQFYTFLRRVRLYKAERVDFCDWSVLQGNFMVSRPFYNSMRYHFRLRIGEWALFVDTWPWL